MSAYEIITNSILDALEKGTVPWQQPFKFGNPLRHNGAPYRGFNRLYLNHVARMEKYTSPYWMTLRQGNEYGGSLRAGSKGSIVVFYKRIQLSDDSTDDSAVEETQESIIENSRVFPMLRYSYAYNASQFNDLPEKFYPAMSGDMPLLTYSAADRIIAGYPNPPRIEHVMTNPCYSSTLDTVSLPEMSMAKSSEAYYATLFHELIHSTGHKSRLCRPLGNGFGTPAYAYEELIAEIGASFLCGDAGIHTGTATDLDNSAAYIASWIKALKNDKMLIVKASGKAESAVRHILNEPTEQQNAA